MASQRTSDRKRANWSRSHGLVERGQPTGLVMEDMPWSLLPTVSIQFYVSDTKIISEKQINKKENLFYSNSILCESDSSPDILGFDVRMR